MSAESEYTHLLAAELENFARAIDALVQDTFPPAPLPRPKFFQIGAFEWPHVENDTPDWGRLTDLEGHDHDIFIYNLLGRSFFNDSFMRASARRILESTYYRPRRIQQTLYAIRAATAWCYARLEGRQKAADDIRKQSERVLGVLEAEMALLTLGKRQ